MQLAVAATEVKTSHDATLLSSAPRMVSRGHTELTRKKSVVLFQKKKNTHTTTTTTTPARGASVIVSPSELVGMSGHMMMYLHIVGSLAKICSLSPTNVVGLSIVQGGAAEAALIDAHGRHKSMDSTKGDRARTTSFETRAQTPSRTLSGPRPRSLVQKLDPVRRRLPGCSCFPVGGTCAIHLGCGKDRLGSLMQVPRTCS